MRFTRIYTGDDGCSHLQALELPYADLSERAMTPEVNNHPGRFIRLPAGMDSDLHNAPARQFVLFLRGGAEIRCGDGSSCQVKAGDMLFAEDIEGEGHSFKELTGPIEVLFLPVPADFQIANWTANAP